jgi:phospholipid/cholesterol/gamma-HCH transport system substrate-binding protein
MKRMTLLRLVASCVCVALVASGCSALGGDAAASPRTVTVEFSRAVQMFPGNTVRVLGVNVGRVVDVQVGEDAAEVVMRIDDPDIKLPADVRATIVPLSLLGERYIQLFPAYEGGPEFTGDRLSLEQTSVPTEQDELLRGLQDYFGALDPNKVSNFVTDAATILEGNGEGLNRLIHEGSGFVSTLDRKKDSLVGLITELNTLTVTLSTRQDAIARLINSYNTVGKTLNNNRSALEGTIEGLSEAASELAGLLIENRDPLGSNIKSLTRSMRTLSRNAETFARTSKWAKKLFNAASRAVDYDQNWLRLSNQGAPLFELLALRLEDRLMGVCMRLEIDECSSKSYWDDQFPNLFCNVEGSCEPKDAQTPGAALDEALDGMSGDQRKEIREELGLKKCKDAKKPKRCRAKKRKASEGDQLDDILDDILNGLDESLVDLGGSL